MTRRVRSGSTQKHKKMPGDATRWGEFDNQKLHRSFPKKDEDSKNETNDKNSKSVGMLLCTSKRKILPSPETNDNVSEDLGGCNSLKRKEIKKIKLESDSYDEKQSANLASSSEANSSNQGIFKKHKLSKKQKKMLKKNKIGIDPQHFLSDDKTVEFNSSIIPEEQDELYLKNSENEAEEEFQNNTLLNQKHGRVNYSPDEKRIPDKTPAGHIGRDCKKQKKELNHDGLENSPNNESSRDISSDKACKSKKERFLRMRQRKREKLGLLYLPPKVEQRLYNLRKALREKGLPPEMIKQIMRKERRKEELQFRRVTNPSKLCFHCREAGHLFADCPKKSDAVKQETGICFKCGSVEHTSFKCPRKFQVQGFPFASCFICKEQGHITRDCPKNKHGVYPKGGRCNLCGNVNHLKKDCPSLIKTKNDETDITQHTINEATSIDAEELIEKKNVKKLSEKKPKIVTF